MYKVKLHPSKCPHVGGWVKRYKEGDIREIADNHFRNHEKDGCMTPLEHYRMVTISSKPCPKCKRLWTKRKKVMLE
jgi:hypothetical protein